MSINTTHQTPNNAGPRLTRFAAGSVAEIWTISAPLMLTLLSTSLMLFLDRLILAHYSTEAMNAAVTAGVVCAVFQFAGTAIAAIAEVFVGQLNGAKQTHRIGEPVWQMIWFAFFSILIFWPTAFFGAQYLIPAQYEELGIPYFQWIMFFGPCNPLIAAISGFFIGQGKTKLIVFAAVIANVLNLLFDIILIFGVDNIIPPLGITGAAIATCCAMVIQAFILFIIFIKKKNRQSLGTARWRLQPKLFFSCLKISVPNALSHQVELTAWALLFNFMATMGNEHVTVAAIAQSVFILFAFLTEGLSVGITSVVSNMIGAKQPALAARTFYAALKLHGSFLIILAIPLIIYPDIVIYGFLPSVSDQLYTYLQFALLSIWIFFLFDGIVWILSGILTAGGDTKYMVHMTLGCVLFFVLLPTYLFVVLLKGNPITIWKIMPLFAAIHFVCYYWRYKSDHWYKRKLI